MTAQIRQMTTKNGNAIALPMVLNTLILLFCSLDPFEFHAADAGMQLRRLLLLEFLFAVGAAVNLHRPSSNIGPDVIAE